MKKTVLKLLPLALVGGMLLAGCGTGKKNPSSSSSSEEPPAPNWSETVQQEMQLYIGEVLPFVQLDEETLTIGFDDTYADYGFCSYTIKDSAETNEVEGYGDLLIAAGFEAVENQSMFGGTYTTYDKVNSVGEISVQVNFYEADETYPAENIIDVTVPPMYSETYFTKLGYTKQTGFPSEAVATTLEGSNSSCAAVNKNGEWFVFSEKIEDEEYYYYATRLVTVGDFKDAFNTALLAGGFTFDAEENYYYAGDPYDGSQASITVGRGYTLINFYGVTIYPANTLEDDVLNQAAFGLTDGNSTYGDVAAVGKSGAKYSANCAASHGIQIRSKNSNSGIIGYLEGGACQSIKVTFDANTAVPDQERKLDIYASAEEFTIADMYGDSMTAIGSLVFDADELTKTFVFSGTDVDYSCIGLRSNNGAIYMTSIEFVW